MELVSLTTDQSIASREGRLKRALNRLLPLSRRNSIRLFFKLYPFEHRQRWPDLALIQLARHDVVFDVGANIGSFSECVLAYQPRAIVYAFEPVPVAFAVLKKKFADYPHVYCENLALGRQPGRQAINVSRFTEASSFLENGKLLREGVYGIDFTIAESFSVSIEALSDYVREHSVKRIKLLKLDVQGYELEVLKGAEPILTDIDFIYTEAQFQELYKGGPLFEDIFAFLSERQFELIRMTSFRTDDDGRLMECDMVFRNRRARRA